jgi:hypothetical protein
MKEWAMIDMRLLAWGDVWASPMLYVAFGMVGVLVSQLIGHQRTLHGGRVHPVWSDGWKLLFFAIFSGFLASMVLSLFVFSLDEFTVITLWVITCGCALLRMRYVCLAYSVGLLGIGHVFGNVIAPTSQWPAGIQLFWMKLQDVHMPTLFLLVGIVHVIEALFVVLRGTRWAMPLFLEGPRTKTVGGYAWAILLPLPLFVWTHAAESIIPRVAVGGWAEAIGEQGSSLTAMALPVCAGLFVMVKSGVQRVWAKKAMRTLLVFACIIGGAGFLLMEQETAHTASWVEPAMVMLFSLYCIGGHEWIVYRLGSIKWTQLTQDARGMRVLTVMHQSVAERLGITSGEIIAKMNGMRVRNMTDLLIARQKNPTFVKLEVIDERGENRFVQQAVYEEDAALLGIVYAPTDEITHVVRPQIGGLFGFLQRERLPRK